MLSHMAEWTVGLTKYGNYYSGIVEENKIDQLLELHRRDTVSTFGTRNSCRAAPAKSKSEMEDYDFYQV